MKPEITIYDAETNVLVTREMTDEEYEEYLRVVSEMSPVDPPAPEK
jgi:hypothetical protein